MAVKRSSTSSSEAAVRAARIPWALVIAVGVVLLVELLIRGAEPRHLISYQYGEDEYYAAANHLDAYGPADIVFLGSSRTKEGIAVPEVTAALEAAGYGDLTVANYSAAGAHADEFRALCDYVLARGRPRLILCGVSHRTLRGTEPRMARSAIFWKADDWRRAFGENRSVAAGVWPIVFRNYLSEIYRTLEYRRKPKSVAADTRRAFEERQLGGPTFSARQILDGDVMPSPLNGQLSGRQTYEAHHSLIARPVSDEHVRRYVSRFLVDGKYVMGDNRVREMEALISACRESGVQLVFFEAPTSDILMRNLPEGVYERFMDRMLRLTEDGSAWFVTQDDLQLSFDDADFAEQSHLNLAGARKLTRAITERVILPELQEIQAD
jgi:predicted nucleic acid-binding protein